MQQNQSNMADNRSITKAFAKLFVDSPLHQLYMDHQDELFLAVRGGYINLYYNCDSIAKVKNVRNKGLVCEINPYYLVGNNKNPTPEEIVSHYTEIKGKSEKREKHEKQTQQKLTLLNNLNSNSHWYCVDVEYCKPSHDGRFDIIAVSKAQPHRVALIELKYGSGAIGGGLKDSGIVSHVRDFSAYKESRLYENLKDELVGIIESLKLLGVSVPKELQAVSRESFAQHPEFYFITLDNNASGKRGYTPKQTIAAYLFEKDSATYNEWGCKRPSSLCIEKIYGNITWKSNPKLYATFLFSTEKLPNIQINDIIDGKYTERIEPQ
jgi:hypothetical protein